MRKIRLTTTLSSGTMIILLCLACSSHIDTSTSFPKTGQAITDSSYTYYNPNYELKISLPKFVYKQFEPVMPLIELINHDSKPLELWGTFKPIYRVTKVCVVDERGITWDGDWSPNIFTFSVNTPTKIIQPGDTYYNSMSINYSGVKAEERSLEDNDIYFDNFGYFKPGKYRAYFDINLRGLLYQKNEKIERLRSNEIQFEITGLNDTDKEVLSLYKKYEYHSPEKYLDIIQKYPDNILVEYVTAEYLENKHYKILNYKKYNEEAELEYDYQNFIKKYPNSGYLLIDDFIGPYIYKHFMSMTNLKENLDNEIENFKELNKNELLNKFLKDKQKIKFILRLE